MDLAHRILLSIECEAYDATLQAFCIVPMLLLHGFGIVCIDPGEPLSAPLPLRWASSASSEGRHQIRR